MYEICRNISTIRWITMKFCTDLYGPQRMYQTIKVRRHVFDSSCSLIIFLSQTQICQNGESVQRFHSPSLLCLPEWRVSQSLTNRPGFFSLFPFPLSLTVRWHGGKWGWKWSEEELDSSLCLKIPAWPLLNSPASKGRLIPPLQRRLEAACYIGAAVTTDALPTRVETESSVL